MAIEAIRKRLQDPTAKTGQISDHTRASAPLLSLEHGAAGRLLSATGLIVFINKNIEGSEEKAKERA